MENLLIIGGSYFAGRVFIEKLISREQFNIFVFNRGNLPLNFERVAEIVGDRDQPELIRKRIPALHWDAVIDFCAYTPEHIRSLIGNLAGSVGHYILISTTTVYADTADLPVKESADKVSAPQPELGPYADYGLNKWLAEQELASLSGKKGFRYTVLRPAIIYGRYNYAPRESYFFDLIEKNRTLILPDTSLPLFSFLRVDDLASLTLKCINEHKVSGEAFNVCGPELVSYQRLVEVLEIITGRRLQVEKLSPSEIDNHRIPLPFPLDHHLVYSCDKIREATGFTFTPFLEGMRETWQYYQRLSARKKNMNCRTPITP
ncbi:MAG: NAD-dependent epimerase/dehydratase family protein [Syntrophobacteraceae bacterium]|nr:NAD-dependent epimerase/dehydratase family protein [Syntrophobacteraceae bacterium]